MFTEQIERFVDLLITNGSCNSEDRDIILYGVAIIVGYLLNIMTTLILGIVLGVVPQSLVFLATFSFLRTYAGGYHCEKAINCYILSSGIVTFSLIIIKFMPKEYVLIGGVMMLILAGLIILMFAPVEASNKPLNIAERRHHRKRAIMHLMVLSILAILLFVFRLNSFAFTICIGVLLTGILVFLQKILS